MRSGRPKPPLELTDADVAQLQSFARSRSLPASLCQRARIVLASARGESNTAIAARLKLSKATVGKWRASFLEKRLAGLHDDVRPGRPRSITDEQVAQLIRKTLHGKPRDGAPHWSVRTIAAETRISNSSVQRYLQLFGLQPQSQRLVQAIDRSVLHREAARRRRPVPEPAGQSEALLRPDHRQGRPARLVQERAATGQAHRSVRAELQRPPPTVRMDRYGVFHPGEARTTLLTYWRDRTRASQLGWEDTWHGAYPSLLAPGLMTSPCEIRFRFFLL